MSTISNEPGSVWRLPAMWLLLAYALSGFTGFFVTISALPAWLASQGTPESLTGLVTTALLVVTVVTQAMVPRLERSLGLATTLGAGALALGAPALLLLVDDGFGWVLAISAVRGIGFGILTVLGAMLAARIVPPARRGEAIGIFGLAAALPNLFAVAGGVALVTAERFGIVAVLGAAPLLGLLVVRHLARAADPEAGGDADRRGDGPGDRDGERLARRAARIAALGPAAVLMVVTLTSGGFMTYLPIARPEGALASVGLLLWGTTAALGRWRSGVLADRFGLERLLPAASGLNVVGIGTVALGLQLEGLAGWTVTLAGSTLLGAGYGAVQSLTLVAAFEQARHRQPATVSAVWNIGFDAGLALGSGAVGLLTAVVSIPGALALSGLLILASIPLAIRVSLPVAQNSAPTRSPKVSSRGNE